MTKQKRNNIIIVIIILILSFGGLLFYSLTPNQRDKIIDSSKTFLKPKEKEEKEEKKLKILDPNAKTRPYAVMVNNIKEARKVQSGLQDAYIVYEIVVEGGLTRFLALYMDSDTEKIGSVRSARHYFLDYALENDAFYVHHGQSPQAREDFKKLKLDRVIVNNSSTGWRDETLNIAYEHTLFTSTNLLKNGLKNKRLERNKELLFDYSVEKIDLSKIKEAAVANNVEVDYSSAIKNSYVYDQEKENYKRYINGVEHIDSVTKEILTFKNIIVYQIKNKRIDNTGRQNLDNIGKGKGFFITNGYSVPITWEKTVRDSQTIYRYENGEEIKLNDGNTFIQIQPMDKSINIS